MIDKTAIIDSTAELGDNVVIGAYSVIGKNVTIGDNSRIGHHVVIDGPTRIGQGNKIHHFSSIGDVPQHKQFDDSEQSSLEIGDRNVIREYCSINRGTEQGGGKTVIGDDNWLMAYVHIAHDCVIGNHTVFANNVSLCGHVIINDYVALGGFTGIHQFCRVGEYGFSGSYSAVAKDIPPALVAMGNPAKPRGINRIALKRHGFDNDTLNLLRRVYKIVYYNGLTVEAALSEIDKLEPKLEIISGFSDFIKKSTRGIVR